METHVEKKHREIKFLDLTAQHDNLKTMLLSKIDEAISTSNFIGGPEVKLFENEFAKYIGVEHCVTVGNGTDALEICLKAFDFPPHSQIIVPSNSFLATSEAVTSAGHEVVFADVSLDTLNVNLEDLENRITDKTKAIIIVHLYGRPVHLPSELKEKLKKYGIKIIEDCAQAHGASVDGEKAGAFGDIATFSFYPGKNLGAMGDGGAIASNNRQLIEKCRLIANHGRIDKYNHIIEGRNSRLDSLQAIILNEKLKCLDGWLEHRNDLAKVYRSNLREVTQITMPNDVVNGTHSYHLFVAMLDDRDGLREFLSDHQIETSIHYPTLLPQLAAYEHHPQHRERFNINGTAQKLISLPIGEHLTKDDIIYICNKIKIYFSCQI